ncbi:MAG: hypothetical protein ACYDD5_00625 [Sulfuricurvum sp.]
MDSEAGRIASIEDRTRKVEDAIIRFEYIADTILVQVDHRLEALERQDDAKSKEIDEKLGVTAKALRESFEQYFKWSIGISSAMFFLFVGYMAYDQGQKTSIHEAITIRAIDARENRVRIDSVGDDIGKISEKLDKMADNQYLMLDSRKDK